MRNKSYIIKGDNLFDPQLGFDKIIRFFTDIHNNSNNGKQENGEKESRQKFPQYIPVKFLHDGR